MKAKYILTGCFWGLIVIFPFQQNYSQELSAKEIVKKADDKGRGLTSQGRNDSDNYPSGLDKKYYHEIMVKRYRVFIDIYFGTCERKGAGISETQIDMWNWIPSIERIIKIPPSMMMQSWMGSDFTNDDLVKESSIVVDYTQKLIGNGKGQGSGVL